MALPKPTLNAAVVCDQAIKEEGTGKWTLVGTFTNINVTVPEGQDLEKVEVYHSQLAIYFCVGGAEGVYPFEVHVLKLHEEDQLLGKLEGAEVDCGSDRLVPSDFAINIRGMKFPGVGRYAVRLIMNGEFIGDKVFDVRARVVKPPNQQE